MTAKATSNMPRGRKEFSPNGISSTICTRGTGRFRAIVSVVDRDRVEERKKDSRTCTYCRRLSARDTVSGPLERLTITCPPLPAGLKSDK